MRIADKTKEQLVEELEALRRRTAALERAEAAHKRGEEAIRKLEEEKLSILNRMSEHVVYQNQQHRVLWANKAAAEAADSAREQLVGCYCYEIWPNRSEPCVNCPVEKARETGKPQASEMTTPDGRVWLIQGYPIRDTDDQVVGLVEVALEITERKQVEEALRKGERKFELLFESTLDGMFVLDAETMKIVLANQAAVDIFGLNSVEGVIGVNLLDFVPPEERERVLRIIVKDMFENDLRQVNEVRGIARDGREIWLSVVGTRTEYRGRLAGLISFSDITERKQAEEALQVEKDKLQSVIDSMEHGLAIMDKDYNILYQSEPSVLTGRYHLGEKCYRAHEGSEKVCDGCPVEQAFKDGKSHTVERRVVTPSGEVFFLENTASPIRNAEGKIISCLEVTRDITERKQAEEALREGEEKYRTIFENVSDVIIRVDKYGKIVDVNGKAEECFGYKPEEVIGKNFAKIGVLSLKDLPKMVKLFGEVIRGKHTPIMVELEAKRKDGSPVLVEVNPKLIKKNGKAEGFVAIIRDITERKQAEDALRESEEFSASLLDNAPNPVMVMNPDTSIRYVNPALEKLTGFKSKEVIGIKQPFPWWIDDKTQEIMDRIRTKLSKGEQAIEEALLQKKNGGRFWVNINAVMVERNGKPSYTLVDWVDITKRKQTEQALADEATRRRILVDQSIDGIVVIDQNGKVYEANQRFADMLGYTPEEVTQLHVFDWEFLLPRERVLEMIRAIDEAGDHFETQHRRKDGTIYDVEISTNGAMFAGQKLIFCVCRDITERKKAEEALQAEKNKLQSVIDALEDGLTIQDRDYNILFESQPSLVSGGYHLGEKCYRAYEGRDTIRDDCPVKKAFKDGKSHTSERRLVTPSGEVLFLENTANPIRDAKGEIVSCLEVTRNITQRKQAGEELRLRAQILDGATDAIFVHDDNDNFVYVNEAACRTHGYSREEFMKMKLPQIVDPERARPLASDRQEILEKGYIVIESAHLRKDGSIMPVEVHARAIGSGKGKLFLNVVRDITERKRAEEKLQTILKTALDGFWLVNLEGKILEVNDSYCKMTGYTREELLKMSIWDLEVVESPEEVAQHIKKIVAQGFGRFETRHRRKDGQMIDVEMSVNYLDVGEGQMFVFARDITERKRAEEALRESEEKLRKMFESVTDGISVVDLNGIIIDANQRTVEMHGFSSKDEILGKSALELIAPSDHEKVATNMRKALTRGIVRGVEYTLLKADGSEFPGELSTSMLKDAAGKAIGHITISRDITERKEAEELYKTLADSSPVGVYILQDGKFRFVNPQFQKYMGFSQDELLGKESLELVHPEDRERVRKNAVKMLKGKRLFPYELRYIVKSGEILWATETVTSIQYRGKRAVLGNFMDVTESKRAEEALEHQRAYFQQLFDNSPEAIVLLDTNNRIVNINKGFEMLFGYVVGEVKGQPLSEVIVPEDRNKEAASLAQSMHSNETRREESVRKRKDGSLVDVALLAYPIWSGDKAVGAYVIYTDITERKHAEEEKKEMEQKAHLASRLASVGEMASGIAHEINNPLTSVIGFSQLLMEGDIPADIKEDVGIIYKEAQRAAGVAKNLLTFARKQAPAKQPTNINSIIDGVLKLRAYEQRVNNIQVDSQLAPDLPEVMADYSQLQQVFINIIINAESAMIEANKGGTLTITTQRVNKTVKASFSDDGPGINRENLNRIFDPFFTTKEVGKGTGLGLSVCHGIVAEHSGRIYARSKLGQGATFVVELPVNNS